MVLFGLVLRFLVDVHRSSMFWCHDYGKLLRLLCQHVRTMAPVVLHYCRRCVNAQFLGVWIGIL
jgi:hypothetical protein